MCVPGRLGIGKVALLAGVGVAWMVGVAAVVLVGILLLTNKSPSRTSLGPRSDGKEPSISQPSPLASQVNKSPSSTTTPPGSSKSGIPTSPETSGGSPLAGPLLDQAYSLCGYRLESRDVVVKNDWSLYIRFYKNGEFLTSWGQVQPAWDQPDFKGSKGNYTVDGNKIVVSVSNRKWPDGTLIPPDIDIVVSKRIEGKMDGRSIVIIWDPSYPSREYIFAINPQ
jgi:hypothetical protein